MWSQHEKRCCLFGSTSSQLVLHDKSWFVSVLFSSWVYETLFSFCGLYFKRLQIIMSSRSTHKTLVWTQNYAVCRAGTSRENLFRGRYRVGKLNSGPRTGRVSRYRLAKLLNRFSFVWGNMMIWAKHLIRQRFLELAYHKDFVLIGKMAQRKLE